MFLTKKLCTEHIMLIFAQIAMKNINNTIIKYLSKIFTINNDKGALKIPMLEDNS